MVIPFLSTGRLTTKRKTEIVTPQTKRATLSSLIPGCRPHFIITIKLIPLRREEIPLAWREKILRSTLESE
jgi:hypothetical protein